MELVVAKRLTWDTRDTGTNWPGFFARLGWLKGYCLGAFVG